MEDRELRAILLALERFRRRRTLRYPAELRKRISVWVSERRRRGDWWSEIAAPLGIPAGTLVRWAERRREQPTMVPVDIIDAPRAGTVTLVAPSGLRLEDVAIVDAIAILQALA